MKPTFTLSPKVLAHAHQLWDSNQVEEAGKLIFEGLPFNLRPQWAAHVLRKLIDRSKATCPEIEYVIAIAITPRHWWKGHDAFSKLRNEVLKLDELQHPSPFQASLHRHLLLAELVAKVTYNATSPNDEFDEDSGWWIAACAMDVLASYQKENILSTTWSMLGIDEKP